MSQTSALLATALVVGLSAIGSASLIPGVLYNMGFVDAHATSVAEQYLVVGGDPAPWANYLCITPDDENTPGTRDCYKTDTSCAVGTPYCEQQQMVGLTCADEKAYQNPTRCVGAQTTLCCQDADPELGEVVCYQYWLCSCDTAVVDGQVTWTCDQAAQQPDNMVPACTVVRCN